MRKNPTSVARTEFVFQGICVNILKVLPHCEKEINTVFDHECRYRPLLWFSFQQDSHFSVCVVRFITELWDPLGCL